MKFRHIVVAAAVLSLAFAACEKRLPEDPGKQEEKKEEPDTSDTPDPPVPVIEKHMTLSDTLDGFHYVAYHIRNFKVHKVYYAKSWKECVDSLNLISGEGVAVVAYSDSSNIEFIPHDAGERKTEYYFAPSKPGLGFPEVWSGFTTVRENNTFNIEMIRRTTSASVAFRHAPESVDSVVVEIPDVTAVFHPCQDTYEDKNLTTWRFVMDGKEAHDINMLPMPVPYKELDAGITLYSRDLYRKGHLYLGHRLGIGQTAKLEFNLTEEGHYGAPTLQASFEDNETGTKSRSQQKISLWDHTYEYPSGFTKTEFPIECGYNLAFRFGSGVSLRPDGEPWIGWNHDREVNLYCDCGFDHLRVPIDEEFIANPTTGEERPAVRADIKKAVDIAISRGVRVIIDLHWLYISQNFPNALTEIHFRNAWRILHDMFKDYPVEMLAYEILNEPKGPEEYWNEVLANSIEMMRNWGGLEKNRVIVCGCTHGQDYTGMAGLELPKGDPNLIVSYHDYYNSAMTFFEKGQDGYYGPMNYPGDLITDEIYNSLSEDQKIACSFFRNYSCTKDDLEKIISKAAEGARRLGLRMFVGEYGCDQGVSMDARINWFRDKCDLFRKYGMAYCNWFLLGETQNDDVPDPRVLDVMIPKKDK